MIKKLIEDLQTADKASKELDADIMTVLGTAPLESNGWERLRHGEKTFNMDAGCWTKGNIIKTPKPYTSVIETALTLIPEGWKVREISLDDNGVWDCVLVCVADNSKSYGNMSTMALAICEAALYAMWED